MKSTTTILLPVYFVFATCLGTNRLALATSDPKANTVPDTDQTDRFVAFCGSKGLELRKDKYDRTYIIKTSLADGFDVGVYFHAFPPGSTPTDVHQSLHVQISLPFLNPAAGLAMSDLEVSASHGFIRPFADARSRTAPVRAQLIQLFRDYNAPDGMRPATAPASGPAELPEPKQASAFFEFCRQNGLVVERDADRPGWYQLSRRSDKDVHAVVCAREFDPGTKEKDMHAALYPSEAMPFPYMNEPAGLAMCDPGVRLKNPAQKEDYERAAALIDSVVKLFKEYHPKRKPAA